MSSPQRVNADVHRLGSGLAPPTWVRGQTVWCAHAGARGRPHFPFPPNMNVDIPHTWGGFVFCSHPQAGFSFISFLLVLVFTICGPDGLQSPWKLERSSVSLYDLLLMIRHHFLSISFI